jgi:hypothetical protein
MFLPILHLNLTYLIGLKFYAQDQYNKLNIIIVGYIKQPHWYNHKSPW